MDWHSDLSTLDMSDVDAFIFVKGNGLALGHHLHLNGGHILQGASDHPAVTRLTVLLLKTPRYSEHNEALDRFMAHTV